MRHIVRRCIYKNAGIRFKTFPTRLKGQLNKINYCEFKHVYYCHQQSTPIFYLKKNSYDDDFY